MITPGCKICGTVYRKHDRARSDRLVSRRGGRLRTATDAVGRHIVDFPCPNESKHAEILVAKARLASMATDARELAADGLDMMGSEELKCKIQGARAALRKKWMKENGSAAMSNSGDLEEVWDD